MEPGRPTFLIGSIGKYGVVKVQGATSLKGTSATCCQSGGIRAQMPIDIDWKLGDDRGRVAGVSELTCA